MSMAEMSLTHFLKGQEHCTSECVGRDMSLKQGSVCVCACTYVHSRKAHRLGNTCRYEVWWVRGACFPLPGLLCQSKGEGKGWGS